MPDRSPDTSKDWPLQERLLRVVYQAFELAADWPTFQFVNSTLWSESETDSREIYFALSASGLVAPGVDRDHSFNLRDDTRVRTTLGGMALLPEAEHDLIRFVASVRSIAGRAAAFRPISATSVDQLRITSDEIGEALSLEPGDLALVRQGVLLRDQAAILWTSFSGPGDSGSWDLAASVEHARQFRGVNSAGDFDGVCKRIRSRETRPWAELPADGPTADPLANEAWPESPLAPEEDRGVHTGAGPRGAGQPGGLGGTGAGAAAQTDEFPIDSKAVEGHDVFVSYASEDKDVARPIASRLRELGYRVWFDEFELKVGMSLRRAIDKGLAGARHGVVVLSRAFFERDWPQRELDGLVARETSDGVEAPQRILPVWHGIGKEDIVLHSPTLADRYAARTADGVDSVVAQLIESLGPSAHAPSPAGIRFGDATVGPAPRAVRLGPVLLGSDALRLLDGALEILLDVNTLPTGEPKRQTAELFDYLRDMLDVLGEMSVTHRVNAEEAISSDIRGLLDGGVAILGGRYDRELRTPTGTESWPGAAFKAVQVEVPKAEADDESMPPMTAEDATAIALAQVRVDRGDLPGAEEALRRPAAHSNGHALLLLGMVLRDMGRVEEAVETLNCAVDAGRNEALTPLGMCLRDVGRLDEAEAVLLRAAEAQRAST